MMDPDHQSLIWIRSWNHRISEKELKSDSVAGSRVRNRNTSNCHIKRASLHLTFDGSDVELWLEPASLALGVGDDEQGVDLGQLEDEMRLTFLDQLEHCQSDIRSTRG